MPTSTSSPPPKGRILRYRGFCVACKRDLYSPPGRHYRSKGHLERVEAARRRKGRQRGGQHV